MPTRRKYNIYSPAVDYWRKRDSQIEQERRYQTPNQKANSGHNVQNSHRQLVGILKGAYRDRYQKARDTNDSEAEGKFERLHAQHALYPQYKKAKEERD